MRVHGTIEEAALARLQHGITVDRVRYGPIDARFDKVQGSNAWLTLGLQEGKNREVRKVLESLGLRVNRLIRVAYGPFQLGNLERGAIAEVTQKVMREQLGGTGAGQGVNRPRSRKAGAP